MASFAKIGLDNKVIEVLSIHNNELLDKNNIEQEINGINFLINLTGWENWVQTSYNTKGGVHILNGTPLRKNYASIGFTYDSKRDAFIAPQDYPSWTLNENTCQWESPIPMPQDDKKYSWDEEKQNWVEIV